jgi:hypothetical protein
MDDIIEANDEADELESFDENLKENSINDTDPFAIYLALAIFFPCIIFLFGQVPGKGAINPLIPFMGLEIDIVVLVIACIALLVGFTRRKKY